MISLVRHNLEPRVQYHDRVIRYVFVDHRVGADFHVVPDGYFSEYARARCEINVVSDRRHPRFLALAGQADREILGNIAIPADDDARGDRVHGPRARWRAWIGVPGGVGRTYGERMRALREHRGVER